MVFYVEFRLFLIHRYVELANVIILKERVRTCKDYVIGREITTVLKIAVDSVTLELCCSRDYFVSFLLVKKVD